jgi:hypothetical protein
LVESVVDSRVSKGGDSDQRLRKKGVALLGSQKSLPTGREQKALSILDMVGLSWLLDQVYFFQEAALL